MQKSVVRLRKIWWNIAAGLLHVSFFLPFFGLLLRLLCGLCPDTAAYKAPKLLYRNQCSIIRLSPCVPGASHGRRIVAICQVVQKQGSQYLKSIVLRML